VAYLGNGILDVHHGYRLLQLETTLLRLLCVWVGILCLRGVTSLFWGSFLGSFVFLLG